MFGVFFLTGAGTVQAQSGCVAPDGSNEAIRRFEQLTGVKVERATLEFVARSDWSMIASASGCRSSTPYSSMKALIIRAPTVVQVTLAMMSPTVWSATRTLARITSKALRASSFFVPKSKAQWLPSTIFQEVPTCCSCTLR